MAIEMDIDIGKIFKDLFSKGKSEGGGSLLKGPYVKIVVAGIAAFAILLMYIFLFYMPAKNELTGKELKVAQIEELKLEVLELSNKVTSEQVALNEAKTTFDKLQSMFHTNTEIEELYRQISTIALTERLLISKLGKLERSPIIVAEESQDLGSDNEGQYNEESDEGQYNEESDEGQYNEYNEESDSGSNKEKQVAFYDFKIILNISGNYSKYLKFRRQISELKKLIIVIQEDIIVLKSENRKGDVKATLVIRTYQMPESESERYIKSEEVI
jgi:Tfp pilus assembly protein PilO